MQYLLTILTYASQIWGITANSNLDLIQVLQNRALRLILNAPTYIKRIHIHKDLKFPALTSRIKVNRRIATTKSLPTPTTSSTSNLPWTPREPTICPPKQPT
ncbi:hypothetical protein TNCV_178671 [Trichonephila clavipes]|nr:hypothetical protein TNCV_178671 [Trichonephila clavipes]